MGLRRRSIWPRSSEHLVRRSQSLLACAWKVNPHAWTARASELPACRVEPRDLGKILRLDDLSSIRERKCLRLCAGKTQAHLAAGFEVVGVVVERSGIHRGHQLRDRGKT